MSDIIHGFTISGVNRAYVSPFKYEHVACECKNFLRNEDPALARKKNIFSLFQYF